MDIKDLFKKVKDNNTHNKSDKSSTSKVRSQKALRESTSDKTYFDYLHELDPSTGKAYIIPMLGMNDPDYCNEYVSMMKFKEFDPDSFNKILNWD